MGKRIPDVIRDRAVKLAKEGLTSKQISARLNISTHSVLKICKEAGTAVNCDREGFRFLLTPAPSKDKEEKDVAVCSGKA